jgi:hypothetical protein
LFSGLVRWGFFFYWTKSMFFFVFFRFNHKPWYLAPPKKNIYKEVGHLDILDIIVLYQKLVFF